MRDLVARHRATLVLAGAFLLAWILAAVLAPRRETPTDPLDRLIEPGAGAGRAP